MSAQVWGNWLMIGLLVLAFAGAVTLRYPGHGSGHAAAENESPPYSGEPPAPPDPSS